MCQSRARCFPKVLLFNVLKLLSELGTINPILQIEKLRLREAKQLAQGHVVGDYVGLEHICRLSA